MELDLEKFELDLETTRAIFARMGVEQFINRTTGINFRKSEGLIFSDLKEAPQFILFPGRASRGTLVTFSTHLTSHDPAGTDVLELDHHQKTSNTRKSPNSYHPKISSLIFIII